VYQISFQYLHPVQRKWTETANYWNFSKSKDHNSPKWLNRTQNLTWTRYSHDKSVYQISFQYVYPVQRKWTKTADYWNFSNCKGHNSVQDGSIVPKTELALEYLMITLCIKFHFNLCIQCRENERKLYIIGIFKSPWAITLSKMAWSYPKPKLP
jgi:hypothetical protein